MKTVSRLCLAALAAAVMVSMPAFGQTGGGAEARVALPAPTQKPLVQIAILLDTSNSMDGLIEQAKTELWRIVNEIAKVKVDGVAPDVQVALYQYGTPTLGVETGFTRRLVPLSDDLDKVSDELFKLRTNGGDEFCGTVIKKAVDELDWSNQKNVYRAIFIAGNESFTQGGVDYKSACKDAATKGIVVNTIFCGPEQQGIDIKWKEGATLADGAYSFIEQADRIARAAAPQDKQISDLGTRLNGTYVPYGQGGQAGQQNQVLQDRNANQAGAAIGNAAAIEAERAITKSNQAYRNGGWDLVDAVNEKRVQLKDLKPEDLPEEMRGLDEKGREEYIARKTAERKQIQDEIRKLSEDRDKYLAAQQPAPGTAGARGGAGGGRGGGGFGGAVINGAGRGR